jgi:hypothetical protein
VSTKTLAPIRGRWTGTHFEPVGEVDLPVGEEVEIMPSSWPPGTEYRDGMIIVPPEEGDGSAASILQWMEENPASPNDLSAEETMQRIRDANDQRAAHIREMMYGDRETDSA